MPQIDVCYFCQSLEMNNSPRIPQNPPNGFQHGLFLLSPDEKPLCADEYLLLFCIDISGSMSTSSQVSTQPTQFETTGGVSDDE